MPKAKNVKYIVEHCSAGYGSVEAILNYHHNKLGWVNPGYHVIIDREGTSYYVHPFDETANGVRGFNHQCIHVCYIGGVEKGNYSRAKDTRTKKQKEKMLEVELDIMSWLVNNGKRDIHEDLLICGHRDFSPDKNLNGMVDSRERIKECPSYDTIPDKKWLSSNLTLPHNR